MLPTSAVAALTVAALSTAPTVVEEDADRRMPIAEPAGGGRTRGLSEWHRRPPAGGGLTNAERAHKSGTGRWHRPGGGEARGGSSLLDGNHRLRRVRLRRDTGHRGGLGRSRRNKLSGQGACNSGTRTAHA
eukprot:scaffold13484_cov63-Phaeocystis_antarctica.AAC.3